ncbi:SH3 domain-containing protein [Rufibacter hautae]|uniref:SH3 domain-containing protein n=1 Tax=Rufibacter hautae TaxID=2595005 RepID=A0A5B6TD93_9BACT|nr:hypothetical protein [Rufibacter hautae]KAA3438128.1 hypothetical protein FOA19_12750 [Rufibacter hautae]
MKKLILVAAFLSVSTLSLAQSTKSKTGATTNTIPAQATANDVKMYRQAGTSSEVLMNLQTTDKIEYHRKLNSSWAVVTVGDKVGYVLFSELTNPKPQILAMEKKRK